MRTLLKGLSTYWKGNSTLTNFFTGGIHLYEAPNEITNEPYVVINADILNEPRSWSASGYENRRTYVLLLFVNGRDETKIVDGSDLIRDTLPIGGFNLDSYKMLHLIWVNTSSAKQVDNRWVTTLEYNCIIEEE